MPAANQANLEDACQQLMGAGVQSAARYLDHARQMEDAAGQMQEHLNQQIPELRREAEQSPPGESGVPARRRYLQAVQNRYRAEQAFQIARKLRLQWEQLTGGQQA